MVCADSVPVRRGVREKLKLSGQNLRDSRYEELYVSNWNCPDGTCGSSGFNSWSQSHIRIKITVNEEFDLVSELRFL